ncbi:MAG: right-handed parallel beta-helix repeat-containing protein, partial [Desulfotomaculaceae bacterium]
GWGTPLWPVGTTMVFIVGGYGHTIVGNMFRRCGGNGVTIWGGASDCVISDNILPEFGKSASGLNRGIVFEGSGSVISNNNLDAANAANSQGIYISGSDNTITGNSIKRIANSAFELASGSAHNVVVGNNGKTTSGLLDSSGQTNEIAHNYWT